VNALRHAYDHPLEAARNHKRAGGKVVGYVSTAVPSELIAAAGAMPVLIRGDAHRSTALADQWMEEQFDPMARSIFDMALAGELQFLDLLIVPRVADSFMRLYLYLREVERLGLCKQLPKLRQFDLLQSQSSTSFDYNLARMTELRERLQEVSSTTIDTVGLRAAIREANENRAALRTLLTKRSAGSISGSDVLRAIGARYEMPVAQHTQLLREPDAQHVGTMRAAGGIRIVVAGNAQDNSVLYEYLEAQGMSVVGDYHWMGDNCCQHDIEESGDPINALTSHYQTYSLSSRRYPHASDELVAVCKRNRAQGVVFFLFAAEEALSWDVPNQSQALEQAGIATVVLDDQPYAPRIDASLPSKLDEFKSRLRP
jgi:benzoyl-CoA reductase/2-hydroxyglutaryl-CoA dehydratase subunit BcrC/BadD/HgdB